ncbi:putative F-box/LRR-repeat protein At3g18150 [Syzygium oleosum]|uniref:putative F-box/LRR-repeat protein At3g18150 n=1 Tax=Syzygium oleosum TaxID=219896 RepID=UPI0024B96430|nr:putative F-box/LRR-repeat protein At3g18150 [Syzygium oleosum]
MPASEGALAEEGLDMVTVGKCLVFGDIRGRLIADCPNRKLNDNRNPSCTSLCDLPEAVLLHILSFLPTNDVVRTSALSKKCEHLWVSVLKLNFNEKEFSQRLRFINFGERTFLLHVCLTKLKALTLMWVEFADEDSVEKLLSGPSLEKLSLDYCIWWKLQALHISAPKLLSLSIVELEFCTDFRCDCRAAISVDHPFEEKSYQFSFHGYKLLKDVANVQNLTLSYDGLQDLNERKNFLSSLPVFANLKKLELNMYRACLESRALQTILSKSSCLESLEFLSGLLVESRTDEGIPDPVPRCFLSSLREITIRDFHEDDDQLLAV